MLQHIPKGEHGEGIYAWKLDGSTGKLSSKPTAVSPVQPNPAFILKHPSKDIVYASTECINECGEVITLQVSNDGSLKELSRESAGGRSTPPKPLPFRKTRDRRCAQALTQACCLQGCLVSYLSSTGR